MEIKEDFFVTSILIKASWIITIDRLTADSLVKTKGYFLAYYQNYSRSGIRYRARQYRLSGMSYFNGIVPRAYIAFYEQDIV